MIRCTNKKVAVALELEEEGLFDYYAGLAAHKLSKHKEAVYFFRKCVKRDFHHADIYTFMGLSLNALGKDRMAKQTLHQGIFLKGRHEALVLRGAQIGPMIF